MSNLGGTIHGQRSEAGYQNTEIGSSVALNRKILRKAFKSNNIKTTSGNMVGRSRIGPFRTSVHLGDVLSRKSQSCGGTNQVNDTHVTRINLGGSLSNYSCNVETLGVTPIEVPIGSGNSKFISDSSSYTRFKTLSTTNLNYNDSTFGGGDNSTFTALNRVRK